MNDTVPEHRLCCGCLRALTAGYVVCFLVLLEGIFVVVQVVGVAGVPHPWWAALSDHNPFVNAQWALLLALGIGDICFALLGAVGIWMSTDASSVLRRFWSMQSTIVNWSVVLFAWWRLAVAFFVAPCVGIVLAFEPPGFSRAHAFRSTLVYVAASVFLVYILSTAYRQACTESALLQYKLDLLARSDRKGHKGDRHRLLGGDPSGPSLGFGSPSLNAHGPSLEEPPVLLGCLSLECTVAAYGLAFGAAFFICFARICTTKQTIGGWAWMQSAPKVDIMVPVEGAAYFLGGFLCLVGFIGIVYRHAAPGAGLEEAMKTSKRSTAAVLVFFLGSVFRLSVFIPVTVMALVESDLCGVYVRGMASTSLYGRRIASNHQISCRQSDVTTAVSVVLWALLDISMVRVVCLLWQDYRRSQSHLAGQFSSALPETIRSEPCAGYGIVEGRL